MPRGGRRPGAGRIKNTELMTARNVIDDAISTEKWRQLNDKLYTLATQGNIRAAELLYRYRFGNPDADPADSKSDAEPFRILEYTCAGCPHPEEQYLVSETPPPPP